MYVTNPPFHSAWFTRCGGMPGVDRILFEGKGFQDRGVDGNGNGDDDEDDSDDGEGRERVTHVSVFGALAGLIKADEFEEEVGEGDEVEDLCWVHLV